MAKKLQQLLIRKEYLIYEIDVLDVLGKESVKLFFYN
jgi:hypothetical protein